MAGKVYGGVEIHALLRSHTHLVIWFDVVPGDDGAGCHTDINADASVWQEMLCKHNAGDEQTLATRLERVTLKHTPAVSWMKSANIFATLFISLQICTREQKRVKGDAKVWFHDFLFKSSKWVACSSAVALTCAFMAIFTVKVTKSVKSLLSQFGLEGAKESTTSSDTSHTRCCYLLYVLQA